MSCFPRVVINTSKLVENINKVIDLCQDNGICVSAVVKGFNGILEIVRLYDRSNCAHIADSRIERLYMYKQAGIKKPLMLLRVPMLSEIEELVKYCDISLNSEYRAVERINECCRVEGKNHSVVLMLDLGDLREGIIDINEAIEVAVKIEKNLEHVKLAGIGTNLGCYGAVKPTEENLGQLVDIAHKIEEKIGRKLDIVSGGATSTLPLIFDRKLPKGINNLRIGEGILLSRDLNDLWGYDLSYMNMDTFILEAELIEIREKPTHPIGELFIDAFGKKPVFEDKGIRKKALAAVGKLDIGAPDNLIPVEPGMKILGGSSDHLILDVHDCEREFNVGDVVQFEMNYGAMLFSTASETVKKQIV